MPRVTHGAIDTGGKKARRALGHGRTGSLSAGSAAQEDMGHPISLCGRAGNPEGLVRHPASPGVGRIRLGVADHGPLDHRVPGICRVT
jgi:hypothetical protein